jgi:hypothetical protein
MQAENLRLAAYRPEHRARWNAFVQASKNGTFLFDRDYMEYHSDRFTDASLAVFEGEDESNLVALLPASRETRPDGEWLITHGGLTYGGWVTDARMTTPGMLRLFELLKAWARESGISNVRYKAMPQCFHRLPAEEDLYALFIHGGRLARLDVSSVIDLAAAPAWAKGRRHGLSKSRSQGVTVELSHDYADFHDCLASVLAFHGATPVHSVAELELLAGRFPDEIKLYAARREDRAIGYVLAFDCGQTVHTQYMAVREEGRNFGALEAILHRLQNEDFAGHRYLSFGISTEQDGRVLNHGLIGQKEMFGGRAMVCAFYDLAC